MSQITITSTGGLLRSSARLYAGDLARVVVTGSDVATAPDRLVLLGPGRDPVATCGEFVRGAGDMTQTWVGYLSLRTLPVADMIADVPAGRAISCAAVLYRESSVVSAGTIPLVSSAMPEQLETIDPSIGQLVYASDISHFILAGDNINITQVGDRVRISSTAPGGGGPGVDNVARNSLTIAGERLHNALHLSSGMSVHDIVAALDDYTWTIQTALEKGE